MVDGEMIYLGSDATDVFTVCTWQAMINPAQAASQPLLRHGGYCLVIAPRGIVHLSRSTIVEKHCGLICLFDAACSSYTPGRQ